MKTAEYYVKNSADIDLSKRKLFLALGSRALPSAGPNYMYNRILMIASLAFRVSLRSDPELVDIIRFVVRS